MTSNEPIDQLESLKKECKERKALIMIGNVLVPEDLCCLTVFINFEMLFNSGF